MIREAWWVQTDCAECGKEDYLRGGLCYECGVGLGYIEAEEE